VQDNLVESNETVIAKLGTITGGGTPGATSSATATIVDDDALAPPSYTIAVAPASVGEGTGTKITYTVNRTGDLSQAGSVAIDFSGSTATNSDYTVANLPSSGVLNFIPGASSASFTVTPVQDNLVESNETVIAKLGTITGGGTPGATSSATATIVDDDALAPPSYTIAVAPASVGEGTGTKITYTVNRTGDLSQAGSVAIDFSGSTATNSDYTVANLPSSGVLNFIPGASSASFTVTPVQDNLVESNETVIAKLGTITGGGTPGATSSATATIVDDDALAPPSYTIAVAPASVGEGTGTKITYTVNRTGDLSQAGSVAIDFSGSTATNSDYTVANLPSSGVLNFIPGASSASFTVTPVQDNLVESNETVIAKLGTITGGGTPGATSSATATIVDDDGTTKKIALTFDDGPDPTWTPQVLAVLKAEGVKATFFELGEMVNAYPEQSRAVLADGHQLANHTFDHQDLALLSDAQIQTEIQNTQNAIFNTTGTRPVYLRPPYGSIDQQAETIIERDGLKTVLWTVDPEDWNTPGTNTIIQRVMSQASDNGIILMHDGGGNRSQTVDALDNIIDGLRAQGYEFVTLDKVPLPPWDLFA
uniref:polysaccharide deacetylase family protein n=1 Tax=Methylobacterium segetis TaxID=2488750 RepID=UPI0014043799